jgi:hypothetical protein
MLTIDRSIDIYEAAARASLVRALPNLVERSRQSHTPVTRHHISLAATRPTPRLNGCVKASVDKLKWQSKTNRPPCRPFRRHSDTALSRVAKDSVGHHEHGLCAVCHQRSATGKIAVSPAFPLEAAKGHRFANGSRFCGCEPTCAVSRPSEPSRAGSLLAGLDPAILSRAELKEAAHRSC